MIIFGLVTLVLLSGCLPASLLSFPPAGDARRLTDPTQTQMFPAPIAAAAQAAREALLQQGFHIKTEEPGFIFAKERIWARLWSWDYAAGVYLFEENDDTRITVVMNGAPDLSMIASLGLSAAAQAAEARQLRIQLFNAIRMALLEQKQRDFY